MKRIILSAAALLALAGSASACGGYAAFVQPVTSCYVQPVVAVAQVVQPFVRTVQVQAVYAQPVVAVKQQAVYAQPVVAVQARAKSAAVVEQRTVVRQRSVTRVR